MKTKQKEKALDAVKMMRDARNKITAETQNMKFEELKKYIDNQLKNSGLKPFGQ
jgi:hypothetical protein